MQTNGLSFEFEMTSLSFNPTAITVANRHAFAHIVAEKSPLVNLALGKWVPVKFAISRGVKSAAANKITAGVDSPCRFISACSTA